MKDVLLKQANEQNKKWPQYQNHWDKWEVVEVKRRIKSKTGIAAEVGDFVLIDPDRAVRHLNHDLVSYRKIVFVTIYSWRTKTNTSVRLSDLKGYVPKNIQNIG